MKKVMVFGILVILLGAPVQATHYEITTDIYTPGLTLRTNDSLYMTDGGIGDLNLRSNSTATIEGTSTLVQGVGGIWEAGLWDTSHLDLSSGQLNLFTINNNATARLTGGLIQQIWSYQYIDTFGPHITIVYSGDLPAVQMIHDLPHLVGNWGNGDPFSIYLSEIPASNYGYDPAIDNIEFIPIPEPTILTFLGLGGLMLQRKKR